MNLALVGTSARAVRLISGIATSSAGSGEDPFVPVDQDPDTVRDAACRLVESSDVCKPPTPPPSFQAPTTGGPLGSLLGFLLWAVLIAVVVAVVAVAVRSFSNRHGSVSNDGDDDDDEKDPDTDQSIGPADFDPSREPRKWRQEADEHSAAGRYRDAVRCRYRALVGDLARRGLLDEIPGRTTGEERSQLYVSAPGAVPFFEQAADEFDRAWFGNARVGVIDDDRLRQLDRDVLANSPSRSNGGRG